MSPDYFVTYVSGPYPTGAYPCVPADCLLQPLNTNFRRQARRARQLFCGRRLLFCTRQTRINTSPTRRTGGPDRHRRVGKIWIVESPSPNEDQMGSCLSLAKERSAAIGAEPTVHSIATVGHTRKVARFSYDLERCGAKASTNRSAACTQVLAIAAPAHARGDWRFRALPANRAAKTPACHCHCPSEVRNAGLRRADRTLAACLRGRLRSNARRPLAGRSVASGLDDLQWPQRVDSGRVAFPNADHALTKARSLTDALVGKLLILLRPAVRQL